jgi:hypothetical protein
MHVEEDGKSVVIYPSVRQNGVFDNFASPSVIVTNHKSQVTLLHRRINTGGRWQLVPFSSLRKDEFQKYIDMLQSICNKLDHRY